MQIGAQSLILLVLAAVPGTAPAKVVEEPPGLHRALDALASAEKFSGAVVIRGRDGVRFARGYGLADPFERRPYKPDTPADSGSLAKPVTSAAVLLLVQDGKVSLDAPVRRYLPEYPHATATVRHLLSHSAGLELDESSAGLANKSNAQLLAEAGPPLFPPGTAFTYCNLCSITLAMLVERVAGTGYLDFARRRLALPSAVTLRPQRLADWSGRAIGYRRNAKGEIERFDSWEGEIFYGAANLSISAMQLAEWGSEWLKPSWRPLRRAATEPAEIGKSRSGLTLGNWYCAADGERCHYLGHHEGFHHMLYWDAGRQISVAMVTNNTLSPGLQQRLRRALVAFAEAQPQRASAELAAPLPDREVPVGTFELPSGETVEIIARGKARSVRRAGLDYPAYPVGSGVRYVPGLDLYVAGAPGGALHWLTLYEDFQARPKPEASR